MDDDLILTFEAPAPGERWISTETQSVAMAGGERAERRLRRQVEVLGATGRRVILARITYLEHDLPGVVGKRYTFDATSGTTEIRGEDGAPSSEVVAALEGDRRRF